MKRTIQTVLVEDDLRVLQCVTSMLQGRCELQGFSSGLEALDYIEKTPNIDLLITDILMPGLNGIALISKVKSSFPEIKIIAISGGGNLRPEDIPTYEDEAKQVSTESALESSLAVGADSALEKPFLPNDLYKEINALIPTDDS